MVVLFLEVGDLAAESAKFFCPGLFNDKEIHGGGTEIPRGNGLGFEERKNQEKKGWVFTKYPMPKKWVQTKDANANTALAAFFAASAV